MSVVGGIRTLDPDGFSWDLSASVGRHATALFIEQTLNASLGPETPTAFDLGTNVQGGEVSLNADASYLVDEMTTASFGGEWRRETYETRAGQPESWTVGPYGRGQGFSAGANGFFGYGPMATGRWRRANVAGYADVEVQDPDGAWRVATAMRGEHFDDFGGTLNASAKNT